MTETIEDLKKFVKEREESFKKNIFPITDAIAKAMWTSSKIGKISTHNYGQCKCYFKHNGVKITYRSAAISLLSSEYILTIKYKWRKVLKYQTYSADYHVIDAFHECDWIDKLNGFVEKIEQEDADWKRARDLKKYKKQCKNLSKKECVRDG